MARTAIKPSDNTGIFTWDPAQHTVEVDKDGSKYAVFLNDVLIGHVERVMDRLSLAPRSSRIRRDGKTRPFWTYHSIKPLGSRGYHQDTRISAISYLVWTELHPRGL